MRPVIETVRERHRKVLLGFSGRTSAPGDPGDYGHAAPKGAITLTLLIMIKGGTGGPCRVVAIQP